MLPGLYPRDTALPTKSRAERDLHAALKAGGLPEGWYAWHSLRLRDGQNYYGEGDYVFVKPDHGFLVMEVKGGQMRCEGGHWLQNGKRLDQTPLEQAQKTHAKLRDQLGRMVPRLPASGVAISFPDTAFSTPPGRNDLRDIVLGAQDMPRLREALETLFEKAVPQRPANQGAGDSTRWVKALHSMWCETWTPELRLGDQARLDEQRRVALDAAQLVVLDMIAANTRTLISGRAGAGKTLLALESARRRAQQGEAVLLLCFTDALAQWLRQAVKGTSITVRAVRQLAVELLRAQGEQVDTHAPGFWSEVSLRAAMDALPGPALKVDSVLVDEGQDLDESDWALVEALAEGKPLWCFSDAAQAFWPERRPPAQLFSAQLNLPHNHRCKGPLADVARSFAGEPMSSESLRTALASGELTLVPCATEADIPKQLEKQVEALLPPGGRVVFTSGATEAAVVVSIVGGALTKVLWRWHVIHHWQHRHRLPKPDQSSDSKDLD